MKWYPSILEVVKADELKTISKGFNFVFEFRIRRTIKLSPHDDEDDDGGEDGDQDEDDDYEDE